MTPALTHYSLDKKLAQGVQSIAQKRGVSADTLSPTKTELTLPGTEIVVPLPHSWANLKKSLTKLLL